VKFEFPGSFDDANIPKMAPNAAALNLQPGDACIRDAYVAGAVAAAWVAEVEARLNRCDLAKGTINDALLIDLANANQLCNDPTAGGAQCKTTAI
jgi:hypothetical protein